MTKKKIGPRRKHVPLRTCVGCREVLSKRTLTRIVHTPNGIEIDPSGKLAGRGAYLHDQRSCWERAMKGGLAQALKTELTEEDKNKLITTMQAIPEIASGSRDDIQHE